MVDIPPSSADKGRRESQQARGRSWLRPLQGLRPLQSNRCASSTLRRQLHHGRGLREVAVTPNGRRAASSSSRVAKVWDLARGVTLLTVRKSVSYGYGSMALSEDGSTLALRRWG